MISSDCKIGVGLKLHHPELVNLYGCSIGNNCSIGAFTEIGKGVRIGNNCKIQAHVFIPPGVTIADNVFIGPMVCFTNDKYPRVGSLDHWELVETTIEDYVSIGANSTIICGVTIGYGSMIGAGSIVTKSIPPNSLVYGRAAIIRSTLSSETKKNESQDA